MMSLSKTQTEQRNAIIESLYLYGESSRADLSRLLDITPATMSSLTSYLLQEGLIYELGREVGESKAGRKKVLLGICPDSAYYMGMELTDTKVFFCLTDNLGQIKAEATVATGGIEDVRAFESWLLALMEQFLTSHSQYPVSAIGIAVPGHYDKEQQKIVSNHPFWSQLDLGAIVAHFQQPIFIKNNVKCMALRELYLGEKKCQNFLFINLRRGIFASYVYQGKIYGDRNYLVGEVGHVVVNPKGESCGCGQAGCLQTYASIIGILKKVRYAFEAQKTPYLQFLVNKPEDIQLAQVVTAYKMGDEVVQYIIEEALDYLAVQIYNVQMTLDVEAILIHGPLFQEPTIAAKLEAKLDRFSTIIQPNQQTLKELKPYNPLRGALGASCLAMVRHFIFTEVDE